MSRWKKKRSGFGSNIINVLIENCGSYQIPVMKLANLYKCFGKPGDLLKSRDSCGSPRVSCESRRIPDCAWLFFLRACHEFAEEASEASGSAVEAHCSDQGWWMPMICTC